MSGVPDYMLGETLDFKFTTRQFSTGAPFAFDSGVIEIYEDNSTTQITGAETLSLEFDGVTGLHNLRVVATTGNGFESGKSYQAVVSVGTVDSVSVVGEVVQQFSIERNGPLQVWDRVLTGSTHNIATSAGRRLRGIQEFQGYESGAIWIDTINGTAGTTDYENGTVENPVDSITDANTLAASLNINKFEVAPGSSITFAAAQSGQVFNGDGWTLALGGQSIVGSTIYGATVSGVAAGTGTTQFFRDCILNAVTHIKGTHATGCGVGGTQTVGEAGDYFVNGSHSAIAGTAAWVWDFGAAIGNTNLNIRNYSGGVQLESMGDTGTDTASIEGWGQVIEGTCTGGTVAIRGNFTVSGITNLTLSDDARFDVAQINAQVDAALNTAIPGSPTADSINERVATLDDDWNNGGRLDLLLDAIPTTAMRGTDNAATAASVAALNDISAADILTTALTEAYAADGAAPTLTQALMLIQQSLGDFAIAGTTLTVKKVDGSTTAATFTLDDATSPTSTTRAT